MKYTVTEGDKHVVVEVEGNALSIDHIQSLRERVFDPSSPNNLILHLPEVVTLPAEASESLCHWSEEVRAGHKSFVISALDNELAESLDGVEVTPTISEAQDIVFLEEVERDLDLNFEE